MQVSTVPTKINNAIVFTLPMFVIIIIIITTTADNGIKNLKEVVALITAVYLHWESIN